MMDDISNLEGITSGEVEKFCRANISTVEDFLAQIDPDFIYGIIFMFLHTGIKPSRLLELLPPDRLKVDSLPDTWVEELADRVLRQAPPDDRWFKRCRQGLQRFTLGLKGNWLGWRKNLPIFVLVGGLLAVLVLTLRAAGALPWLPSMLALRDQVLVTADDMEAGRTLKPGDLYPALLPLENDYFKPGANLEGLILARKISSRTALRTRDVLRSQVVATNDIKANAVIRKEQVTLAWTPYQPGAALTLEEVYGHKATQPLRKDGIILSEFVAPLK